MKEILPIFKKAFQAGIAMAIITILFLFIGFESLSMGLAFTYNLMIILFILLVFIFFGIVGAFIYFEYKKEFKNKHI